MAELLYCSFCAKSQDEVRRLIAGPAHAAICDECTQLCAAIVVGEGMEKQASNTLWLSRTRPVDSTALIKQIVRELREEASGISAGTAETLTAAQGEAREPGAGTADAPNGGAA